MNGILQRTVLPMEQIYALIGLLRFTTMEIGRRVSQHRYLRSKRMETQLLPAIHVESILQNLEVIAGFMFVLCQKCVLPTGCTQIGFLLNTNGKCFLKTLVSMHTVTFIYQISMFMLSSGGFLTINLMSITSFGRKIIINEITFRLFRFTLLTLSAFEIDSMKK